MTTFIAEWEQWHRTHDARLADAHGFLAVTALHWLSGEPERFPDAPGAWSTTERGVVVQLAADEELVIDGASLGGEYEFGVIPERASINVVAGDAVIEVAKRGGFDIIRPRHPDNPRRVNFAGTPSYAPDPRWVVPGWYVPFETPRPTAVGAVVDGLTHVYDAPGRIEFELAGRSLSLTAFEGHRAGTLSVLFTDETSGVTTYAANRSLEVAAPEESGAVWLDFNRASNLPCAYTPLATCPLPPAENHLPIAIEAGNKIPV